MRVSNSAALVAVCLTVFGFQARAAGEPLAGSLDRWLETEAAPALVETLGRHPRFKGETIRVVALRNGEASATSNRLVQAVEQRLTRLLLRADGLRIAWPAASRDVCKPPTNPPLLLGVEIEPAGAGQHRLHLGIVDVAEGVWVSGVSYTWRGRLGTAGRQALHVPVSTGVPGSLENPLPIAESARIGQALRDRVACVLPSGLDGGVYVAGPTLPGLGVIAQGLARDLAAAALLNPAQDEASAAWVMQLETRPVGASHELIVVLRDAGQEVRQQLATVMVKGLEGASPGVVAKQHDGATTPIGAGAPAPELLGPLRVRPAAGAGICRGAQQCVEVGFRLAQPAYVLVLSSDAHSLQPRDCTRGVRESRPGERWFRVRVSKADQAQPQRPDAGLYVLAIKQRNLAYRVSSHVHQLCTSGPRPALQQWADELEGLLDNQAYDAVWRSVHLRSTANGIVRL